MKTLFQNKWGVTVFAIICTLLWGSAFPVIKISNSELQIAQGDTAAQLVFAGMRFLLAGLILLFFLFLTNRSLLKVKRSKLFLLFLLGIVQTTGVYYFFYVSLSNVTGMEGAILSSSEIFLAMILAHFYYKNDNMNWKKTVGIIAGFAGIVLANWGQNVQFDFQLTGEGFMILSGLTSAIAVILTKELATDIPPLTLTAWQLTIGAIILLLIGFPQIGENAIVFTPFGLGLLIYSAVLSSVAFALWAALLKYNKASEVSIYKFLAPVFGTILSAWFIPGEGFNLMFIMAIGFVAFGIIIINYTKKQTSPP
ncbi:DMT family transporter [Sporosarcina highlanderae]|uniref:DMT family transporter n=1 Tax=Sporosarcina highlanderae TaxID=3035916 RepID=A0ABT8JLH1_9BACL|nr:DMT family transporter [Sporosarcina highlanderae]MDN4605892.1 DMT family transporter [Sporosarcina highlanderae]